MAAEYVEQDWSLSFIYPGLAMGAVGGIVFLLLVPRPKDVGLALGEGEVRRKDLGGGVRV